jgi:hypothetical protein
MSKPKENTEKQSSETETQNNKVQSLQELIQHLQTQLAEAMLSLSSKDQNPNWLIDSINQSTPIPSDSIRVSYSLKIEAPENEILNFSNTTVIHQATGVNPVNTVSRVNTILTSELVEPAVLVMQNFISGSVDKYALKEEESNLQPMTW